MTEKFKAMIAEAAARANAQITAVQKGEYHPVVRVITAGTPSAKQSGDSHVCPRCGGASVAGSARIPGDLAGWQR